MKRTEIIFSYCKQRCHASIVKKLDSELRYIGALDGYSIYALDNTTWFDQFGFVAVKEA